tara:strand:- start:2852 stop:3088 length:237 start_codon:yes stop_codon:yes gene_type:complete
MYTEDEAKKKWCPEVRMSASDMPVEGNHASNRSNKTFQEKCHCLGSGCMMWRWAKGASVADSINGKRPGYCGLAGKPE